MPNDGVRCRYVPFGQHAAHVRKFSPSTKSASTPIGHTAALNQASPLKALLAPVDADIKGHPTRLAPQAIVSPQASQSEEFWTSPPMGPACPFSDTFIVNCP